MRSDLLAAPDLSLWRLGHSTLLFKINGQFWLTDPVLSERASPFQFLGPKNWKGEARSENTGSVSQNWPLILKSRV